MGRTLHSNRKRLLATNVPSSTIRSYTASCQYFSGWDSYSREALVALLNFWELLGDGDGIQLRGREIHLSGRDENAHPPAQGENTHEHTQEAKTSLERKSFLARNALGTKSSRIPLIEHHRLREREACTCAQHAVLPTHYTVALGRSSRTTRHHFCTSLPELPCGPDPITNRPCLSRRHCCSEQPDHLVVFVGTDGDEGHVVETVEVSGEVLQRRHKAELALGTESTEIRAGGGRGGATRRVTTSDRTNHAKNQRVSGADVGDRRLASRSRRSSGYREPK